jgi:peptide/nickel transport system ATP-binding protein
MSDPILDVRHLKQYYNAGKATGNSGTVYAVDDVSFSVFRGETLSIVGESGCGKSSVARSILRLVRPTAGQVLLDGQRIDDVTDRRLRSLRKKIQVVFQDPYASLNPRMKVGRIIAEPIRNFKLATSRREERALVLRAMDRVRLPANLIDRYPHEFSGGQRQRVGIARALAAEPDLMICDEAVSALDVSVKAQIVNLLQELQKQLGLAILFISHDLAIVEHMTDRVAVMYLGKIVETGGRRSIFGEAVHPYTRALLSAVPIPRPGTVRERIVLNGDVPSPLNPPSGCRFHTRCAHAIERCRLEEPVLIPQGQDHAVACHLALDLSAKFAMSRGELKPVQAAL